MTTRAKPGHVEVGGVRPGEPNAASATSTVKERPPLGSSSVSLDTLRLRSCQCQPDHCSHDAPIGWMLASSSSTRCCPRVMPRRPSFSGHTLQLCKARAFLGRRRVVRPRTASSSLLARGQPRHASLLGDGATPSRLSVREANGTHWTVENSIEHLPALLNVAKSGAGVSIRDSRQWSSGPTRTERDALDASWRAIRLLEARRPRRSNDCEALAAVSAALDVDSWRYQIAAKLDDAVAQMSKLKHLRPVGFYAADSLTSRTHINGSSATAVRSSRVPRKKSARKSSGGSDRHCTTRDPVSRLAERPHGPPRWRTKCPSGSILSELRLKNFEMVSSHRTLQCMWVFHSG